MSWAKPILTGFIVFLGLQSAVRADTVAYELTGNKDFGTIDLDTGAFSSIGFQTIQLAGLGEIGSTLYGLSFGAGIGTLYTIDPSTGAITPVGTDTTYNPVNFGSTLTGLYAVDFFKNLYSVDPTTGKATLLGSTGLPLGSDYSLSTNSGTLYFASGADLYTLNTTTGLATLVGPTGGPQFGGLVLEGSTLYGGEDFTTLEVDKLSTADGAATVGPGVTGTASAFFGLAAIPATTATPEPQNVALLFFGLLAGARWIQMHRSKTRSKRQVE
jgi:hypothetical protein